MNITQLLVDARRCEGDLNDAVGLGEALRSAVLAVGAKPVGELVTRFVPHGVTVAYILAESHVVLSTWPEHHLALLDVLLCHPGMEPEQIWTALAPRLGAQEVIQTRLQRAP